MNLRPLNKTALIEELPAKDKETNSGIVLTEKKLKTFKEGKVIATNTDIVSIGDKVIFNTYGPMKVSELPPQFVVKEHDLLAVVE